MKLFNLQDIGKMLNYEIYKALEALTGATRAPDLPLKRQSGLFIRPD